MLSRTSAPLRVFHLLRVGGGVVVEGMGTGITPTPQHLHYTRPCSQHHTPTTPPHPHPTPANEGVAEGEDDLIERKRNKSRLRPWHYKRLHGQPPSPLTEDEEAVESLRNQRHRFGHYGAASRVNMAKAWPSREELELEREWEKVSYPHSVHDMIAIARKERQDQEEAIRLRQEDISRKLKQLDKWKSDLKARIAKQEQLEQEAKEKKERLIEEVRDILGFRIDPRDERFKEALEQKEKEEKKKSKAAKKFAKEQRMLEQLQREVEAAGKEGEGTKSGGREEDGNSLQGTIIA